MWQQVEYNFIQQRAQADTNTILLHREGKHTNADSRMAAPRLTLAVVVLMLAVITLTEALYGPGPKKCCTRFSKKPVPKVRVQSYTRTSQQCPFPGVLLKTVENKIMCARPSATWVKELIKSLDAKSVRAGETSNL